MSEAAIVISVLALIVNGYTIHLSRQIAKNRRRIDASIARIDAARRPQPENDTGVWEKKR